MSHKRSLLSLFLSLVLVVGMIPLPAFADEADSQSGTDAAVAEGNGLTAATSGNGLVADPDAQAGQAATLEEGQPQAGDQTEELYELDVSAIQFVYIESEELAQNSKQNIAIGFEDDEVVTYQWQVDRGDGQGWVDVKGGNESKYTYVADRETITYSWRLIVTVED